MIIIPEQMITDQAYLEQLAMAGTATRLVTSPVTARRHLLAAPTTGYRKTIIHPQCTVEAPANASMGLVLIVVLRQHQERMQRFTETDQGQRPECLRG